VVWLSDPTPAKMPPATKDLPSFRLHLPAVWSQDLLSGLLCLRIKAWDIISVSVGKLSTFQRGKEGQIPRPLV
jgi:hypothetical protein